MKKTFLLACGAALSLALGCSSQPPAEHAGGEHGEHGEHHGEHHEGKHHHDDLPPAMRAFHDVMAPLWHAEKGPERTDKTCRSAGDLDARAAAVEAKPGDGVDEAAWKEKAHPLVEAVHALAEACVKEGQPDFEARFHDVHEAFHALMESH